MTQIHELTAIELAAAISAGELSPVAVTDHYLRRTAELNDQVGAFYTVTAELAAEQALAAEKAVARAADPAELPPLTGVPMPIKDLNMVAGVRQTLGSLAYENFVPDTDDYVVAKLKDAGVVITGKTSTPEFGLPCYTETRIGPPARTPWDLSRSAGGSSGGAAAAVAAGLAPAAQGSDGAGSIRIPASVCGLFGIKPSRGRVSGGPLAPDLLGFGVDGPIARTVADAALLLDVMTGNFPGDMYTQPPLPPGESFLGHASRPPGRLLIGRTLQRPVPGVDVHPDCVKAWDDASALLASLGHEVEDIAMPLGEDLVPFFETIYYTYATLTPVDPSQEQELLPLTRYLRKRGRATAAPDFLFAQAYMQFVTRPAVAALSAYDAILTPTLAQPPRPVGYFDEVDPAENFERQKRFTPWTAIYNVAGLPAVSVPLHWSAEGLPIGVMLAGRMGGEATLISLSAQLEEARPWRGRHPPIWGPPGR
ncbi:MAG TPA: amidase [Streptosporangiaceae bacterium]|nr:amidase [Streptosporangiaceae bacterium]HLN69208.1 amidase [Streptosporangiaceae bacterium]